LIHVQGKSDPLDLEDGSDMDLRLDENNGINLPKYKPPLSEISTSKKT
jgi:hypothetical protein